MTKFAADFLKKLVIYGIFILQCKISFDYFSKFLMKVLTVHNFQKCYAGNKWPLNVRRHCANQKQAKEQIHFIQHLLAFYRKYSDITPFVIFNLPTINVLLTIITENCIS